MTSPSPLLFDTYYHVFNRGVNRENIFLQERNYSHFLKLYIHYIDPITETFAFCLLRNHFHLLLRVKSEAEIQETLRVSSFDQKGNRRVAFVENEPGQPGKPLGSGYVSKKFSNFFNAYAKSINQAYGRTGSLFQHPFGRVLVTTDSQFWNVIAYIHQNPQKHQFVTDFREWKWTSYQVILSEKPTKLARQATLDWFGGKENYLEMHQQWVTDANSQWFAEEDFDE